MLDLREDSSPEIDEEDEEEMEVEGPKHRKLTRAEKSKYAAKRRRDKEAAEFENIINMLPFPNEELEKMDKSSVVKLTTSYFKMLDFVEKEMKTMTIKEDAEKAVCKTVPNCNSVMMLPTGTSENESKLMLEALDGFLILLDRKRNILFVSHNVEDHLGLSQVHLIGKPIEEFLEEKDIPELRKQFNLKFLTQGKRCDSMETDDVYHQLDEHRMFYVRMLCQYKNNKTKYKGHTLVQWSGRLKMRKTHKANNFATTGMICVCKVMQTNSILEIRMDGNMFMSRHNLDMTFTFCDPRIITLIGYEPSEVIGQSAYQFHNPLDAERVRNCHSNLIVKGSSVSKYYRFVGKNCDWVWMQTRATIIYNTNNIPQYIVCMNYIISEEEGVRVLMEEDKESLSCTGVMDISCKPYKSREYNKTDNPDHHSDNGYHSSYSPYSSINASPLSESSFSHRLYESDDCGASIGDTTDDFPMSVVQECASSLDPDAADDEEMIKFIESLEGSENDVSQNNPVMRENGQWNSGNSYLYQNSSAVKQSLQRIKSCPHVSSLHSTDNCDFDDSPIQFMCNPTSNIVVQNNINQFDNNVISSIPKQGLVNIQIGSLSDGNFFGSSTLSEALPKEISDFCMQYAESMADMQSQDIISQFAHDNFFPDLDSMGNQSRPCVNNVQTINTQPSVASCQTMNNIGLSSPSSQPLFTNVQNSPQSMYPPSPQMFYARNTDTPNSYMSGHSMPSPQQSYSNMNSPLSIDTSVLSPASDISNVRSPVSQTQPCSTAMNNLTLNAARSPLRPGSANQSVGVSQNQASFTNPRINGCVSIDRNGLLNMSSANGMSQPSIGNHLVNTKIRTNGHSLCNGNGQQFHVRMAPPSQTCSQSRASQSASAPNSKNGKSQNGIPSKGLRNVKSMSELEKMLRGYSPPFLHEKDGKQSAHNSTDSGCTLLQQMLTGTLSGEKYIEMEKQRKLNSAMRTSHS